MKLTAKAVAALTVSAACLGASGVAFAVIPDVAGVIHACYAKQNGALRVSDAPACTKNETAISWNKVGPAGLTWQGIWSATTTYQPRDAVAYQGSSYLALATNTASTPPGTNWQLLAAAGTKGDPGEQGATGAAGATGPAGPAGPAGTSGALSDVYSASTASVALDKFFYTTLLTLSIPAGIYLAQQTVTYHWSSGAGTAWCYLDSPTAGVTIANGADISTTSRTDGATSTAQGVVTATAASTLTLRCIGDGNPSIQRATITALTVGTSH